jgi:hypothetical protein
MGQVSRGLRVTGTDLARGLLHNCPEANGRDWGVILATPKSASPLQTIEKTQLKSVLNLTLGRPFVDGHSLGRNRKLLGNRSA